MPSGPSRLILPARPAMVLPCRSKMDWMDEPLGTYKFDQLKSTVSLEKANIWLRSSVQPVSGMMSIVLAASLARPSSQVPWTQRSCQPSLAAM